ncbi:MAG: hypothetical protein KME46_22990 [Brasilonema angustatum HA4187-MV1]|nr:hypothetical protein [Brasilonema angustatum HA4187-MV1]
MRASPQDLWYKTSPVTEVIKDGSNGLLVDFFSPQEIAERLEEVFNHPDYMSSIRTKARKTIQENYALAQLLPQHLQWLNQK